MIEGIREKVASDLFEFSRHALDESFKRRVSVSEVCEAIAAGEVIEEYPQDKYGPGCLLFGRTLSSWPLHIQCSHSSRPLLKIITLYEPDPTRWIDCKIRKK